MKNQTLFCRKNISFEHVKRQQRQVHAYLHSLLVHDLYVMLTFTTLWANSADDNFIYLFFFFFQEKSSDISCKLSILEKHELSKLV